MERSMMKMSSKCGKSVRNLWIFNNIVAHEYSPIEPDNLPVKRVICHALHYRRLCINVSISFTIVA